MIGAIVFGIFTGDDWFLLDGKFGNGQSKSFSQFLSVDHRVTLIDKIGLFLGVGYFGEKDNVFLIGVLWEKIVEVDEDEIIIGELGGDFLNGFVDVFNIKTVFAAVAAEYGCGWCGWYVAEGS